MKVMWLAIFAAAAVFAHTPLAAAPADVNAQEFYSNALQLEKKGMAAMLDKRLKPMTNQMKDAASRAKTANAAATERGQPLYCVPESARKKGLDPRDVIAMLGRLPDAERRSLTLGKAWQRMLVRTYPCTG